MCPRNTEYRNTRSPEYSRVDFPVFVADLIKGVFQADVRVMLALFFRENLADCG